jgi:hypothetical protein
MAKYDLIAGDTDTPIEMTVKDSTGTVVNLTNCTVRCRWEINGVWKSEQPTVTDAVNGVISLSFDKNDLPAGTMHLWVQVEDATGLIQTSTNPDDLTFIVGPKPTIA